MTFYEICGFVLSIATLGVFVYFLFFYNFKNTSKYVFIYLLLYQALATTIFIIGIWKCIWKLIFNQ